MDLPSTVERVPRHTLTAVNRQIRDQISKNIDRYGHQGPEAIDRRLKELDREWDIERMLEANAASMVLLTTLLGFTVHRRWFIGPAVIGGFLLQHALQGWCPPLPVFRRMGIRTQSEIEAERHALKALKGDFEETARRPMPAADDVFERFADSIGHR